MNRRELSAYFRKIGAEGGRKSRRVLTSEEARAMALKSAKARSVVKRNEEQGRPPVSPKNKKVIPLKSKQKK